MREDGANVRVRKRIKEWIATQGHGSQHKLAQAVTAKFGEPRSDQWISDILASRQDVTLRDLDAIADHMKVPPGDLVRKNDRNYLELRMVETKLVRYFRVLPVRVAENWMLWLDFMFQQHEPILPDKIKPGWLSPEDEAEYRRTRKLPK